MQIRGLLELDLQAIDLRRGLAGLVVILAAIPVVLLFGTAGVIAGLAALFVIMTDEPGSLRSHGLGVLVMTGFGTVIAALALTAGTENVWMATLLTFVVTAAGTLAAGLGGSAAIRGLLLSLWAIVALSFGGDVDRAVQLTSAYVIGGLIAAVVVWLRFRMVSGPALPEEVEVASQRLEHIFRSPLGWFSLLRAIAVAFAMAIGATFFPAHPIWAAVTVLVVLRPRAGEAIATGVLRTTGTLAGVVVAEVTLVVSADAEAIILVGFLAAGFGMAAFGRVNYAIMVGCVTALLVFTSEFVGGAGESAAVDRLLETILGAAIAFVAMGIGAWVLGRRVSPGQADTARRRTPGEADEVPG
jgi:hypothetical protein